MVFIGKFPRRKDKSCPEILKVVDIFRRISYIWTANWITWNTISQNIPTKFQSSQIVDIYPYEGNKNSQRRNTIQLAVFYSNV